jgi:hypothetical protein
MATPSPLRLALVALVALPWAASCDGKATASDPGSLHAGRDHEFESCTVSVECDDGLRCFDGTCQRTERSNVGDYYAANGARLLAGGHVAAGVTSYAKAEARYEADHLHVPPDLDCAYGAALVLAKKDHEKAELGARVLHRCLMGTPAGSSLRLRALASLAQLDDDGLEPAHLAVDKPADVYLSRAPSAPATDKLKIVATGEPPPSSKSFPAIVERIGDSDLRAPLVACWQKFYDATKKPALAVSLPIRSKYVSSGYDDEPGSYKMTMDAPPAAAGTPVGDATACVHAVLEPALTDLKGVHDSFQTRLSIKIQ